MRSMEDNVGCMDVSIEGTSFMGGSSIAGAGPVLIRVMMLRN